MSSATRPIPVRRSLGTLIVAWLLRPWVVTLLVGLALFGVLDWAATTTENLNLVPSLICVGAFLGPIVFVVWVWEHAPTVPMPLLWMCFLVGGILGVTAASILEYRTVLEYGGLPTTAIGLAEETSKLIVPLAIFFLWNRYRSEGDGLLIGVAAGMGFAAFETMGYGLTALLRSQGQIGHVEQVLFVRNLLSPAGHAAWTGLICAALWRARLEPNRMRGAALVVAAFALAVTLHALWDSSTSAWQLVPVALLSVGLLMWRIVVMSRKPASSVPGALDANPRRRRQIRLIP
jgi:RsiW-degrading membrane proteinase PrsW (M82 family)